MREDDNVGRGGRRRAWPRVLSLCAPCSGSVFRVSLTPTALLIQGWTAKTTNQRTELPSEHSLSLQSVDHAGNSCYWASPICFIYSLKLPCKIQTRFRCGWVLTRLHAGVLPTFLFLPQGHGQLYSFSWLYRQSIILATVIKGLLYVRYSTCHLYGTTSMILFFLFNLRENWDSGM